MGRSMMARVAVRVWLVLSVLLALGLAGTYVAGQQASAPAGWTLDDELALTGAKWVAIGLVLAAAVLFADNRCLGWLLLAPAAVDGADAVAEFARGYPAAGYPALVTAALSTAAAGWLLRHADDPPILRRRHRATTGADR